MRTEEGFSVRRRPSQNSYSPAPKTFGVRSSAFKNSRLFAAIRVKVPFGFRPSNFGFFICVHLWFKFGVLILVFLG